MNKFSAGSKGIPLAELPAAGPERIDILPPVLSAARSSVENWATWRYGGLQGTESPWLRAIGLRIVELDAPIWPTHITSIEPIIQTGARFREAHHEYYSEFGYDGRGILFAGTVNNQGGINFARNGSWQLPPGTRTHSFTLARKVTSLAPGDRIMGRFTLPLRLWPAKREELQGAALDLDFPQDGEQAALTALVLEKSRNPKYSRIHRLATAIRLAALARGRTKPATAKLLRTPGLTLQNHMQITHLAQKHGFFAATSTQFPELFSALQGEPLAVAVDRLAQYAADAETATAFSRFHHAAVSSLMPHNGPYLTAYLRATAAIARQKDFYPEFAEPWAWAPTERCTTLIAIEDVLTILSPIAEVPLFILAEENNGSSAKVLVEELHRLKAYVKNIAGPYILNLDLDDNLRHKLKLLEIHFDNKYNSAVQLRKTITNDWRHLNKRYVTIRGNTL